MLLRDLPPPVWLRQIVSEFICRDRHDRSKNHIKQEIRHQSPSSEPIRQKQNHSTNQKSKNTIDHCGK